MGQKIHILGGVKLKKDKTIKLGRCLRSKRKEKHITAKELGNKLNLSEAAITAYERGIRSYPLGVYMEICNILEIDPKETYNQS